MNKIIRNHIGLLPLSPNVDVSNKVCKGIDSELRRWSPVVPSKSTNRVECILL